MGLGIVHARSGQLKARVRTCFQRVLSINPKEPRATANLLVIFKQTGNFKGAQALIDALDESSERTPIFARASRI